MSVAVETWKPAEGCPQCKRANEIFYEDGARGKRMYLDILKVATERYHEIERLNQRLKVLQDEYDEWGQIFIDDDQESDEKLRKALYGEVKA